MAYYKLKGTSDNRHEDWVGEVIFDRDEETNETQSIGVNKPAELTKEQQKTLKDAGYEIESVSKSEAEALEAAAAPAGPPSGPVFGDTGGSNQDDK